MGWAIRRVDGTYRSWNARLSKEAQDAYILTPDEVWEERETAPNITTPSPTVGDVIMTRFDNDSFVKAFASAILDAINELRVTPNVKPVISNLEWRQRIMDHII